MTPYYEQDGVTIYHGDCRKVLSLVSADLVITDPPYPGFNKGFEELEIEQWIDLLPAVRQFVFWPAKLQFNRDFSAVHIWHKPNGCSSEHYERIFERNGGKVCRVFRRAAINSAVSAQMAGDCYEDHPTQKPVTLMTDLLALAPSNCVLDPFCGSGTTLLAAKRGGRKAIGIEIEERYCEIAAKRLAQGVLPLSA